MADPSRFYRVVKHLADGEPIVYHGNGKPFTKHSATRFANQRARDRANVTRVEVQKVETIEVIVPAAVAHAEAQADAGRRMAS